MRRRDFFRIATATTASLMMHYPARGAGRPRPNLRVEQTADDRFLLLRSRDQQQLRILQLTDTHFGNPEDPYPERDRQTFRLIRRLVDQQQPDLVIHTGDFVNNDRGHAVRWDAVDFMNDLGVPWTHTLGNHDIGALEIEDYRQRLQNAAFGHVDHNGDREYAFRFDVVTSGQSRPEWTIFCFDSGHAHGQKHVSDHQLAWFGEQIEADRSAEIAAPALAMIHIPVVEFERLRDATTFNGIFGETVCYESDTGQTFAALRRSGRVRAVFSGHDHENDYCGPWRGIELVYGRVTGYSGYGGLDRGARLIELDVQSGSYRHRLVFADGGNGDQALRSRP